MSTVRNMSDDDSSTPTGDQVPLATSPVDYVMHGTPQMVPGPDGLPVMAGAEMDPPAPEGLTPDNFVCNAVDGRRERCVHYRAILVAADGQYTGEGQARSLRRYCRALATASELMELTEVEVYACELREPPDPGSAHLIPAHEAKLRARQERAARTNDVLEM